MENSKHLINRIILWYYIPNFFLVVVNISIGLILFQSPHCSKVEIGESSGDYIFIYHLSYVIFVIVWEVLLYGVFTYFTMKAPYNSEWVCEWMRETLLCGCGFSLGRSTGCVSLTTKGLGGTAHTFSGRHSQYSCELLAWVPRVALCCVS